MVGPSISARHADDAMRGDVNRAFFRPPGGAVPMKLAGPDPSRNMPADGILTGEHPLCEGLTDDDDGVVNFGPIENY